MFLWILCRVANRLDKLGYYNIANDIDEIIKHFATGSVLVPAEWNIISTNSVEKARRKLPQHIQNRLDSLMTDLKNFGPFAGGKKWRNFGKMKDRAKTYHCHIGGGHPTYVAFWRVLDSLERTIEIYYVGTHEDAPY